MQHNEKFGKRCVLQNGGVLKFPDGTQLTIGLLIDGFSLAHQLYRGLDWIHGGEYAQFAKSTSEFCRAMALLGVKDVRVFMDGSFDAAKLDTILSRRRKTAQVCKSVWAKLLSTTETTEPHPHHQGDDGADASAKGDIGDVVAPLWMMSVFIKTLKENGVTVYFCDREADFDIVQFYSWAKANKNSNNNNNDSDNSGVSKEEKSTSIDTSSLSQVDGGVREESSTSTAITSAATILSPETPVTLAITNDTKKKKKKKKKTTTNSSNGNDNSNNNTNNENEQMKSSKRPFQWVVLAQDSDYCTYPDLDHYLPISEFKWESALQSADNSSNKKKKIYINCLLYGAESTATGLGIARKYLPVFATLVGNDNTSHLGMSLISILLMVSKSDHSSLS